MSGIDAFLQVQAAVGSSWDLNTRLWGVASHPLKLRFWDFGFQTRAKKNIFIIVVWFERRTK